MPSLFECLDCLIWTEMQNPSIFACACLAAFHIFVFGLLLNFPKLWPFSSFFLWLFTTDPEIFSLFPHLEGPHPHYNFTRPSVRAIENFLHPCILTAAFHHEFMLVLSEGCLNHSEKFQTMQEPFSWRNNSKEGIRKREPSIAFQHSLNFLFHECDDEL